MEKANERSSGCKRKFCGKHRTNLLAWRFSPDGTERYQYRPSIILPPSVRCFQLGSTFERASNRQLPRYLKKMALKPHQFSNLGLHISLPVIPSSKVKDINRCDWPGKCCLAVLNCRLENSTKLVAIYVHKQPDGTYVRSTYHVEGLVFVKVSELKKSFFPKSVFRRQLKEICIKDDRTRVWT
jgi:hypothetical protein